VTVPPDRTPAAAPRRTPTEAHAALTNAARRGAVDAQRRHGVQGGRIAPHRSMIGLRASPALLLDLLVLPGMLLVAVFVVLDPLTAAWRALMRALGGPLGLGPEVGTVIVDLLPSVSVAVPTYLADAGWPTPGQLAGGWLLTGALALAGVALRGAWTPVGYLLRALAILQLSAQVWFTLAAPPFPYALSVYGGGLMTTGVVILLLAPFLVGATFFVFDFPLARKLALGLLLLGHLAVLFPLQATVHVWIIQRASMLAMPVLFLVFGVLLDVFVYVALYGWAMSWPSGRELDAAARRPPVPSRRARRAASAA
jgi:hypothetical protein